MWAVVGPECTRLVQVLDAAPGKEWARRTTVLCPDLTSFLAALQRGQMDLIVVGGGLQPSALAEAIQLGTRWAPSAPVIVVVDELDSRSALGALRSGADEVVARDAWLPESVPRIIARAEARHDYTRQLQEAAYTDPLTGIPNRRAFLAWTERALLLADRVAKPCLVLLADMDDLRTINTLGGHKAGDEALRLFATALQRSVRASDIAARIGGDEFAITAFGARDADGPVLVSRIRSVLQTQPHAIPIPQDALDLHRLDFAAGWVTYEPSSGVALEALLDAADVHLFADKAVHAARAASVSQ